MTDGVRPKDVVVARERLQEQREAQARQGEGSGATLVGRMEGILSRIEAKLGDLQGLVDAVPGEFEVAEDKIHAERDAAIRILQLKQDDAILAIRAVSRFPSSGVDDVTFTDKRRMSGYLDNPGNE